MSANVNAMVKEAIRLYRANKRDEAQTMLLKATELDENNEQAWMWLSAVVDSVEDQMVCLENVLVINPSNADAKRGLDLLKAQQTKEQKAANPFEGVDPSEWGDIDSDTTGFMEDLDIGIDTGTAEPEPPAVTDTGSYASAGSDYQTGYETDFADAMFSDNFDEDDPFGADEIEVDAPVATADPAPAAQTGEIDFDAEFDTFAEDDPQPVSSFAEEPLYEDEAPDLDDLESGFLGDDDDDDFGVDMDDYFEMLPANVKATRSPGIDEKYPALLMPLLILLVIGNLGAAGFLVFNLVG